MGAREARSTGGGRYAVTVALGRGASHPRDEEPLTVTVESDGTVTIMTTEVAREELVGRLRAIAAERSDDRVYLRADGAVSYRDVAEVMGALNAGGFASIGLVTDIGGPAFDEGPRLGAPESEGN